MLHTYSTETDGGESLNKPPSGRWRPKKPNLGSPPTEPVVLCQAGSRSVRRSGCQESIGTSAPHSTFQRVENQDAFQTSRNRRCCRCPRLNCEILWALHNHKTTGTFSLLSGASGTDFCTCIYNTEHLFLEPKHCNNMSS